MEQPVPASFEGIPVVHNMNSWFFPYEKERDPSHIDQLWNVFCLGLQFADAGDDELEENFRNAFDQALGFYGVSWTLTSGLYWSRPWVFLSLDNKSRAYLSDKLQIPVPQGSPKKTCTAREYLHLMNTLCQRFEQPDFGVHSFPELSLEAWTYNTPAAIEPEPEVTKPHDKPEPTPPPAPIQPYTLADILQEGCFLELEQLTLMLTRLREKKNLILQGPPGTGKTWLSKRLAMALIGQKVDNRKQLRSVQFHPNLSYEDFVRGWRPGGDGTLMLCDGVFMEMVKAATTDTSTPYVLVIEEINRGSPSQIFGELLTLLEAGKRSPADAVELCYPDQDGRRRPVHVPENLFVIGTMNIADRSLALVDMAFRRRFAFIDLEPVLGDTWRNWVVEQRAMEPEVAAAIQQRLGQLNDTIAADNRLGKAFRIGHSYVTPTQSLQDRDSREWFAEVVASELRPLLQEYWFDAPADAEKATAALLEGW